MKSTPYELLRFPNPAALAKAAASDWLGQTDHAAASVEPYCVALAGGRIARQFLQAVADRVREGAGTLQGVHFFWGDERCVPPSDTESNFYLASELLLQPLAIPGRFIHRIQGEVEPSTAALNATVELSRCAPAGPENQPVIDLIFLGLGENGHTASLFPEEPEEVRADRAVYRPVIASKPPPRRITLGYAAIAAARQVWVLASGAGKEQALRDSLAPGGRTPLGRVLAQRTQTRIYTDIG
jgi:6-phosphogluconolactonase